MWTRRAGRSPPPQYDNAYDFSDGLAMVVKDGKMGYVDRTGTYVFPLTDCLTQEEKEGEGLIY